MNVNSERIRLNRNLPSIASYWLNVWGLMAAAIGIRLLAERQHSRYCNYRRLLLFIAVDFAYILIEDIYFLPMNEFRDRRKL